MNKDNKTLKIESSLRQKSPSRKNNAGKMEAGGNEVLTDETSEWNSFDKLRFEFKELAVRPSFVAHLSSEQQKVIGGLKKEVLSERAKAASLENELDKLKQELLDLQIKYNTLETDHQSALLSLKQQEAQNASLKSEIESLRKESENTPMSPPSASIPVEPVVNTETQQETFVDSSSSSVSAETDVEEESKRRPKNQVTGKKKDKNPKKDFPAKDDDNRTNEETSKLSKFLFFRKKDNGFSTDTEISKKPTKPTFLNDKNKKSYKKGKQDGETSLYVEKSPKKVKASESLFVGRERSNDIVGHPPDLASIGSIAKDQIYGAVFGVKRGSCTPPCDCICYKKQGTKGSGYTCANCGHYPFVHEDLGRISDDEDEDELSMSDDTAVEKQAIQAGIEEHWILDYNDFVFLKLLGKGNSSTVYYGTYNQQEVAIKVLRLENHKKDLEDFKKEMQIMSELRSPHIVHFHGATFKPKQCIVLEYCPNGSLFHILQNKDYKINWKTSIQWMIQTVKGINTLHLWKPQIVHRDLKSLNLLLDSNKKIKVCDFGLSRFVDEGKDNPNTLMKMRGTFAYISPEVYHGKQFTTKADIYSIGIIIWEILSRLLTGKHTRPYAEYTYIRHDFQIVIQAASKGIRPTMPHNTPQILKDLYLRCVEHDPNNRPSCMELLDILEKVKSLYEVNKDSWDNLLLIKETKENAPTKETEIQNIDVQTTGIAPVIQEESSSTLSSEDPVETNIPPLKNETTTESHMSEDEKVADDTLETHQKMALITEEEDLDLNGYLEEHTGVDGLNKPQDPESISS